MEVTMIRHDCTEQLKNGEHPTVFVKEPAASVVGRTASRLGSWYVLDTVLGHPDGIRWNKPMQGEELIRIPLYSYTTKNKDLEELFAVGLHIMATVTSHPTTGMEFIDQATIVVGNVYDGGPDKGYQVWIGIAFRVPS